MKEIRTERLIELAKKGLRCEFFELHQDLRRRGITTMEMDWPGDWPTLQDLNRAEEALRVKLRSPIVVSAARELWERK